MGGLQSEIHEAKELASSLEHSLNEKLQSGKERIRRASRDLTSSVSHALDDVVGAVSGGKGKGVRRGSLQSSHREEDSDHNSHHIYSRYYRHGHQGGEEGHGFCGKVFDMIKHRFASCAPCVSRRWQAIHDLGSSSRGFVWITLLLEFLVFSTTAYAQNSQVFIIILLIFLFRWCLCFLLEIRWTKKHVVDPHISQPISWQPK